MNETESEGEGSEGEGGDGGVGLKGESSAVGAAGTLLPYLCHLSWFQSDSSKLLHLPFHPVSHLSGEVSFAKFKKLFRMKSH